MDEFNRIVRAVALLPRDMSMLGLTVLISSALWRVGVSQTDAEIILSEALIAYRNKIKSEQEKRKMN